MASVIAAIRGLSPFGPIFGKELRTTARRKRTYFLRFGYLGVLLLILLMFFAVWSFNGQGGGRGNSGVARRAQQLSEMGTYFFVTFSFFTMIAMALIGPILTSTAINSERLHKTLPVLLMTPINAWQVVAGKLFSRLLIALTLIGLSLPVLAVVRLLGGVETHQVFAIITLSVVTVLWTASIGLFLSTLMNRPYAVILLAYGLLGTVYFLVPMLVGLVLFNLLNFRAPPQVLFSVASLGHPAMATVLICVPDRPPFGVFEWYWCAAIHAALSALLLVISGLILRRMARKENEGAGTANVPAVRAKKDRPAVPATDPADAAVPANQEQPDPARKVRRRRSVGWLLGSRDVSDNPVLWREIRRPLVARRWQAISLSVFFVGTLLFIYGALHAGNGLDDAEVQIAFATIFCGILTVLTCVLAGTAIAQEKESDTWTLLLATPISARRIVFGKISGLLRRLIWPSALIVTHFLIFTIAGVINWTTLWVILWMTFTTNLIWVATGVYFSLRLKTVTFAVILNLLAPAILYGGAAIVLTIAGITLARSDDWAEVVGLYAPYVYMVSAVEHLNDTYQHNYNYYGGSYNSRWSYGSHRVWVPVIDYVREKEFVAIVFAVGMMYLLASAGIVWLMIVRFNHIVGRAIQRVPFLPPALRGPAALPAS